MTSKNKIEIKDLMKHYKYKKVKKEKHKINRRKNK